MSNVRASGQSSTKLKIPSCGDDSDSSETFWNNKAGYSLMVSQVQLTCVIKYSIYFALTVSITILLMKH